jgi:hypothetical protein
MVVKYGLWARAECGVSGLKQISEDACESQKVEKESSEREIHK